MSKLLMWQRKKHRLLCLLSFPSSLAPAMHACMHSAALALITVLPVRHPQSTKLSTADCSFFPYIQLRFGIDTTLISLARDLHVFALIIQQLLGCVEIQNPACTVLSSALIIRYRQVISSSASSFCSDLREYDVLLSRPSLFLFF